MGSETVRMISGFYCENRGEFAKDVQATLNALQSTPAVNAPRILIKGAPLESTTLHRLVEQHGGFVAAEDEWRGSRAAGESDISMEGDPVVAIFEKYYYDAVSPRVWPSEQADAWFHRQIEQGSLNGVLFYVPLEDDVVGWDYPRHLQFVQSQGVPSLLVRDRSELEPSPALIEQIASFVGSLHR